MLYARFPNRAEVNRVEERVVRRLEGAEPVIHSAIIVGLEITGAVAANRVCAVGNN